MSARGGETSAEFKGLELLEGARELIEHAWCQGADARAQNGAAVDPWAPEAVSWSLLGAIVAVLEREAVLNGEMALDELAAALYALADLVDTDSLAAWNDHALRSRAEVWNVLDQAVASYEGAGSVVLVSSN